MTSPKNLIINTLAVILLVAGFAWIALQDEVVTPLALSFQECAERGYEVLETEPRTCTTPEGMVFTEGAALILPEVPEQESGPSEEVPEEIPTSTPVSGGCVIGGCSGQLCVQEGDPAVSTCEYRAEYACYSGAVCERQASGQCGWTQTPELLACLDNPPPLQ